MQNEELKKEYEKISQHLAKPEIYSDAAKVKELMARYNELKKQLSTSSDQTNGNTSEIIVEIRGGVGGKEASLFAQDLFRMYSRYAELKKWKLTTLEASYTELGGLKEIIFEISGKEVYKKLRNESGVHRVQRVPETEKAGRVHTSAASVAVLPKAKQIDIEIKSEDIKIETYRSSGPGGQNVNKVSTAVRITHLPSGMVVSSQQSRSQTANREVAMTILRSRLLMERQEKEESKIKKERKEQIGTGARSEKIRTYNFPQDRVTDHRINKSWHNIARIMDGNLDEIIEAVND